jgi:hypothetical protein
MSYFLIGSIPSHQTRCTTNIVRWGVLRWHFLSCDYVANRFLQTGLFCGETDLTNRKHCLYYMRNYITHVGNDCLQTGPHLTNRKRYTPSLCSLQTSLLLHVCLIYVSVTSVAVKQFVFSMWFV